MKTGEQINNQGAYNFKLGRETYVDFCAIYTNYVLPEFLRKCVKRAIDDGKFFGDVFFSQGGATPSDKNKSNTIAQGEIL